MCSMVVQGIVIFCPIGMDEDMIFNLFVKTKKTGYGEFKVLWHIRHIDQLKDQSCIVFVQLGFDQRHGNWYVVNGQQNMPFKIGLKIQGIRLQ